jgi:hypothetical protein
MAMLRDKNQKCMRCHRHCSLCATLGIKPCADHSVPLVWPAPHGLHTVHSAHLPWILLGLRAAPCKEDNISRAQAFLGTLIVLPDQFLDANANAD